MPEPIVFEIAPSTGDEANDAEQASVPQYAAKKDEEGINNVQTVAIFTVTTGADSEEDLRGIVEDLRAKNPDLDGLAVFFKPQGGAFVGSGFAFDDAETEEAFLKSGDIEPAEWEAGKEDGTSILLE